MECSCIRLTHVYAYVMLICCVCVNWVLGQHQRCKYLMGPDSDFCVQGNKFDLQSCSNMTAYLNDTCTTATSADAARKLLMEI